MKPFPMFGTWREKKGGNSISREFLSLYFDSYPFRGKNWKNWTSTLVFYNFKRYKKEEAETVSCVALNTHLKAGDDLSYNFPIVKHYFDFSKLRS